MPFRFPPRSGSLNLNRNRNRNPSSCPSCSSWWESRFRTDPRRARRFPDRITGFTRLSAVQHPVNLVNPVQKNESLSLRALRGGGESGDRHRLDRRVATGIFSDCHRLASTWRAAVHLPCPWLHSLCPATFFFGRVRVNAPQNLCCEYKLTHSPHSRTRTSSSCRCVNPGPWGSG